MISVSALVALFIIIIAVIIWQARARATETAVRYAAAMCKENGLQFLDDSVAYQKFEYKRNESGRLCFVRQFHFEFYQAELDQRLKGRVTMYSDGSYQTGILPIDKKVRETEQKTRVIDHAKKNQVVQLDEFRKFKSSNDE